MQIDTTTETFEDETAWKRAKQQARNQRELYGHILTYVLVGVLLVVIDVASGSAATTLLGLDWAFWPIAGWGLAVLLHTLRVFGPGANWEERKAAKLYESERKSGSHSW